MLYAHQTATEIATDLILSFTTQKFTKKTAYADIIFVWFVSWLYGQ